jgi:hypothetical protein
MALRTLPANIFSVGHTLPGERPHLAGSLPHPCGKHNFRDAFGKMPNAACWKQALPKIYRKCVAA